MGEETQMRRDGVKELNEGVCPRPECGGDLSEVDAGTLRCRKCQSLYAKIEGRAWEE